MPDTSNPITRITISLRQRDLEKLDRLGTANKRSRSNMIQRWIDGAVDPKS